MLVNTPPKGWNSWNTFGCGITEQVVRETAEAIVSKGLKDKGYEYVVIDDCWSEVERDENGSMVVHHEKFPSGMKALADYIHSLGLKFGMYTCAGMTTCAGFPGSFGHEWQDAQMFADFGVDFLKYDCCAFPNNADRILAYNRMSMALKATGRDILFSACEWGLDKVETWARSVGAHMYRTTGDIGERFSALCTIGEYNRSLMRFSSQQCYADPDMMIVGMDGVGNVGHPGLCDDTIYRTHFAYWCMMNAPLMIGADVRKLRPEMVELLSNEDLLRINNDPECRPFIENAIKNPNCRCFFKYLSDRQFAIGFFNFSDDKATADFRPFNIGFNTTCGFSMKVREIFTGETIENIDEYLRVDLDAHDCSVYIGEFVPKK